jgi:hypothetical protein
MKESNYQLRGKRVKGRGKREKMSNYQCNQSKRGATKKAPEQKHCSLFIANCSFLLFFFLFIFNCSLLVGLDFSFRPRGFVFIPDEVLSVEGNAMYGIGGGGDLGFEVDLSTLLPNPLGIGYTLGVEGGLLLSGMQGESEKNVNIYSFGGSIGLYYFPLSRLFTRIDGAIGAYIPDFDGKTGYSGLYLRGGGEIGFRFTPGFTIAANAGWRQFQGKREEGKGNSVFSSGFYAGVTAQLSFQTGRNVNRDAVGVVFDQYDAVYPAFMQLYQTNGAGSLVIRNNENAEIRDVRVSFRASPYTASEFPCGSVSFIARGRSAELPLLADFSPEILRFTDKGRILGEVVIRYSFLGQEREAVRSLILATHNRNTVTEGDAAALAAFISPTFPETTDYAKFIAGLSRNDRRAGHNQNLQYAIWLFEGLRAGGIILGDTYANETENSGNMVVQFPAETLSYRSGNARDLTVLFAGCLESVGIQAAFVSISREQLAIKSEEEGGNREESRGDEFLVAVNLGINQGAAETLFNGTGKILIIDGGVWLPLSMSAFNEGFTAAWARGVKVLDETFKEGKQADFVLVEEAWAVYPPAPLPEQGGRVVRTDANAAAREVNRAIQQYIAQEIQPLLTRVQAQVSANPTAALYNRLAIVQVRAGRIPDGKANYERAAGMGSVPAMTNRGNLALSERDYATAERWFRQALARDSQNGAALRGLEQVEEKR